MADGHGTTVTFGTSSFSASLVSVNLDGVSRAVIDETYMSTSTAMAFEPASLYDGGEVTLGIKFAQNSSGEPPVTGATETVTIDWSGSGKTSAFSAFVINYSGGATIGESVRGEVKLKITGAITNTWGS